MHKIEARFILLFFSITFSFNQTFAQKHLKLPSDSLKQLATRANYALFSDHCAQGNFEEATAPLYWLLTNAPDVHNSIYINGVKVYHTLATMEKVPARKEILQDSVMLLYDLRILYFGEEANVFNRKVSKAYGYYRNKVDKLQDLKNMFERAFELNGKNIFNNNLAPYFDVICKYKHAGNTITDEEVLAIYDQLMAIIDHKVKVVKKNIEVLEKSKEVIDKIFSGCYPIDCDFVQNNLGDKLKADPTDLNLAKRIVSFCLNGKCTDIPIFLFAAEIVFDNEPTYGLGNYIGKKRAALKDYNIAIRFYNEAMALTEDKGQKAATLIDIGKCYTAKGEKVEARKSFRAAIEQDPTQKIAYELIGDLYLNSEECFNKEDVVEYRAVYIAAYKMYALAGNTTKMAEVKEQFPSASEIFFKKLEVGQSFTVGCWINEIITLQKREG
ncbi:hypothetical protein QQ008_23910 [Fulvivirgaceae bacterium BMA10]|uniref:Tetratricopeptide repeat protein n=1 Tax=Splendidivirga corallicola TaxID=3051826 RepID=A0ABT8KUL5_9BACT|nr:hypothetical protein [Fulvivirgaceae bacterium BMA10]